MVWWKVKTRESLQAVGQLDLTTQWQQEDGANTWPSPPTEVLSFTHKHIHITHTHTHFTYIYKTRFKKEIYRDRAWLGTSQQAEESLPLDPGCPKDSGIHLMQIAHGQGPDGTYLGGQ